MIFRYGHLAAVPSEAEFFQVDITDASAVHAVFGRDRFDAVFHLAAEAYIDESITDPGRFYSVNLQGGINILEGMHERTAGSKRTDLLLYRRDLR